MRSLRPLPRFPVDVVPRFIRTPRRYKLRNPQLSPQWDTSPHYVDVQTFLSCAQPLRFSYSVLTPLAIPACRVELVTPSRQVNFRADIAQLHGVSSDQVTSLAQPAPRLALHDPPDRLSELFTRPPARRRHTPRVQAGVWVRGRVS